MTFEMIGDAKLGSDWYGLFYAPANRETYSAERHQRAVAVFDSLPMPFVNVLSWKSLSWTADVPTSTRIYAYARSATSDSAVASASWSGPMLNGSGNDISGQTGNVIQIRLAMYSSYSDLAGIQTPSIHEMSASCFTSSESETFYTQAFPLGFRPKHILLTYNGQIPEGALLQFAVSGVDSENADEYQIISPNSVTELNEISELSDDLKIRLIGISSTEIPFVVDEFAVAFSGDIQKKVNKP